MKFTNEEIRAICDGLRLLENLIRAIASDLNDEDLLKEILLDRAIDISDLNEKVYESKEE